MVSNRNHALGEIGLTGSFRDDKKKQTVTGKTSSSNSSIRSFFLSRARTCLNGTSENDQDCLGGKGNTKLFERRREIRPCLSTYAAQRQTRKKCCTEKVLHASICIQKVSVDAPAKKCEQKFSQHFRTERSVRTIPAKTRLYTYWEVSGSPSFSLI